MKNRQKYRQTENQAENRCREAEKEREHWKLEAQLGGLRLKLMPVVNMIPMFETNYVYIHQNPEAHITGLCHILEAGGN